MNPTDFTPPDPPPETPPDPQADLLADAALRELGYTPECDAADEYPDPCDEAGCDPWLAALLPGRAAQAVVGIDEYEDTAFD
jgi:hypothetical protein